MSLWPEVLVGGYPNSGTSFLCHLVVQLGKSPGSSENLKGADSHNRWGYFEHLPIRKLVWEAGKWHHFTPDRKGFLPDEPLVFNDRPLVDYADRIRRIAEEDGVELYKDNSLPLTFRLFPKESKYIIITRRVEAIHESPKKAGFHGYTCSLEELRDSHYKYHELVKIMAGEVDCLTIQYEDFKTSFDHTLQVICNHLEVELDKMHRTACRAIFRPHHASHRPIARIIEWLHKR